MNTPTIWPLGALCRAIADSLELGFNPVTVRAEVSGFTRAASGHCYFGLKDDSAQIRCAMFRRAANQVEFPIQDGQLVEVRGRLGIYEARGDLQLVVESMRPAGQGALFEQFLKLKARLEAQGLFDATRKRSLPSIPRGVGLVTSLGSAACHDVVTALVRRAPHVSLVIVHAPVQGAGAAADMVRALSVLYRLGTSPEPAADVRSAESSNPAKVPLVDAILLVRGGGSMEDLWAFNDEQLAQAIARSPVPVICGVGHETDFTIADFVADLRAPTPTAAAEMVAQERVVGLRALDQLERQMLAALARSLDSKSQRCDQLAARLGRPSARLAEHRLRQHAQAHRLSMLAQRDAAQAGRSLLDARANLAMAAHAAFTRAVVRLDRAALGLSLLDPSLVLQRGFAWLSDAHGQPLTGVQQVREQAIVRATLADGEVDLQPVSPL